MSSPFSKLARIIATPRGAKLTLIVWLLVIVALSVAAPGAKKYAVSSGEGSIKDDTPSAVARHIAQEQFPSDEGLPVLLVFHAPTPITEEERAGVEEISKWLSSDRKPEHVASAIPYHQLPQSVRQKMASDDQTTLILNAALEKDLASDQIYDTLRQIRAYAEQTGSSRLRLEMTGPAAIAADTIALFKNADLVLMLATIALILIILVVIYRSPLLAVIPLVISGAVYQVVDRLLGLSGKNGWFLVDKQALSIMMILLFAVLTDYCLFLLARYKEELGSNASSYDAMKSALTHVAEPILFSGGTVLAAMLTLFAAAFKPYHHFAPVFSVAMAVIVLAGLTLIPALFAILGRNVFWPYVPKRRDRSVQPTGFWSGAGTFVTKKPAITAGVLLLLLAAGSLNIGSIKYSFNLLNSFPDNVSSRTGFELLKQRFPPGQLAPVSVILKTESEIVLDSAFSGKLTALTESIQKHGGVHSVTPEITPQLTAANAALPRNFLSDRKHAVMLQATLSDDPYAPASLSLIGKWREASTSMLQESGFDPSNASLHFAGQTAEQYDVKAINRRDTIVIFSLIAILITIMLAFQARSVVMAITMMATMLLSYTATLGFGWMLFHDGLGFDSISYRLPVYTFVFLIALGVDYNIMLVSRIREEASKYAWKEAVSRGVSLTGGVISSAGLILAATFCVLITQPLQELYLFGSMMAIGIILDTFLVRGMLLPALMALIGNRFASDTPRGG
ncbi:MMPL family transporter [Paenibacillus hemerocallicola]|uniref:MMPL family transporter n=1 Tax=Paenibacillus hemerocallicola TaxID=1172614 RepID=A0A5C4TI53_9BACL|nr:MMPL family transporter [Paenibacillus hemerocallicola]TNJ68346.1 MMPL family transporter [Paenibacillus hemerocallicola]